MDKKNKLELKREQIREQIEVYKKNAIEEIQKEQIAPAMWSISALIDLKAQEGILKEIVEED